MAIFILVHGMFHGGWCWDRLIPALEAAGHSAVAPDLAGCGGDATPLLDCTLDRWAGDIAATIAAQDAPVILVGHSRGGLVASAAAERAADKVGAIVYLTALMLPDGGTMMSLPQLMAEEGMTLSGEMLVPRMSDDGMAMLPPLDADDLFHAGYSEDDRAWSSARLGHEPVMAMATPLSLSDDRYGRLPKIYIKTTKDRTLPIEAQRAMIQRGKPDEVITLETDHMPIVTHVPELAAILDDIARRYIG